jgi:hypothetical protein
MMSLYMAGNKLDAAGLEALNVHGVAQAFGYPIATEVAIGPGVYMDQPNALRPLADMVVDVLHDTAATLRRHGLTRLSQACGV